MLHLIFGNPRFPEPIGTSDGLVEYILLMALDTMFVHVPDESWSSVQTYINLLSDAVMTSDVFPVFHTSELSEQVCEIDSVYKFDKAALWFCYKLLFGSFPNSTCKTCSVRFGSGFLTENFGPSVRFFDAKDPIRTATKRTGILQRSLARRHPAPRMQQEGHEGYVGDCSMQVQGSPRRMDGMALR